MLSKGLAIDPETGRPIVEVAEEKKAVREKQEEQSLRDQALYAGMLSSEPGKLVVGIVRDRLVRRVQALIGADPEAKTLVGLLNDLSVKDDLASNAVEQLFNRFVK